jgi:hypothetical protein
MRAVPEMDGVTMTMTSVLRVLAGVSVLALLLILLLLAFDGFGLQGIAAGMTWEIAFDLAFTASIVGLVATAQRAVWGWFTGVLLAIMLGVLSPVLVDVLLPALGLARPLWHLVCGSSFGPCPLDPYVALLLRGLAPMLVLLSTVARPQPIRRVGAQAE